MTTPTGQEEAHLRKCLDPSFDRAVLVVLKSAATPVRFHQTLSAGLEAADRARVVFLAPEDLPDFIRGLSALPDAVETRVNGYRVKAHREPISRTL